MEYLPLPLCFTHPLICKFFQPPLPPIIQYFNIYLPTPPPPICNWGGGGCGVGSNYDFLLKSCYNCCKLFLQMSRTIIFGTSHNVWLVYIFRMFSQLVVSFHYGLMALLFFRVGYQNDYYQILKRKIHVKIKTEGNGACSNVIFTKIWY